MWILNVLVYFYLCCSEQAEGESLSSKSYIFGLRSVDCNGPFLDGIPVLYTEQSTTLHVYGTNLTSTLEIGFTHENNCDYVLPSELSINYQVDHNRGVVTFTPPSHHSLSSTTKYYACLKEVNDTGWVFQGTGKHVSLYIYEPLFAKWVLIAVIVLCYVLSAIVTGLNLGLMALDNNELQLLKIAGTATEKKYATKIIPVRSNGNFLVCSLVIAGTLSNAISTVAIESFFSDIITVIITTAMIVLFCEILPQSICSAFPLTVGGRTIYITRACMILTAPVSYPLGKFLTWVVGKELTAIYTKERLRELLKMTQLPYNEHNIISGTLEFGTKKVEEVMTVVDDIFKLPITAVLNFEMVASILASGFSRIPIYDGDKSNIQYVILTKDLALLDPDDKIPVRVLVQNTKSICHYVQKGTTLDHVLGKFKDSRRHILFVTDDVDVSDKSKQNVIGLVTFEDIVEEIFQMEIIDETDTIFDNRGRKRLSSNLKVDIISLLLKPAKTNAPSENLKLAAYHFLSEVEAFSLTNISQKVLITLLHLDIFFTTSGKNLPQDRVYVRGVPADYFVMILEGQMEVKIGNEELKFEAGSFRYFGMEVLGGTSPFTPDYTLEGVNRALYLKISRTLYRAALLATRYEKFKEFPDISAESEEYMYFLQIVGPDANSNN